MARHQWVTSGLEIFISILLPAVSKRGMKDADAGTEAWNQEDSPVNAMSMFEMFKMLHSGGQQRKNHEEAPLAVNL